ncbi:MAG: hypothetical protein ACKO38_21150, partial [Planctomycetota bacterium]
DEVKEEIATSLARPRAEAARSKALDEARRELDDFARWYRTYEPYVGTPEASQVEKRTLDAKALADRIGVAYGKTPLVDGIEVQEQELGKSAMFSFSNGFSRISFAEIAYRENLLLYKAEQIFGDDPDVEFLYWKTEEKASYVPELAEVRDQVIATLKRQKALALATKSAEEKVKEASGKDSLKAAFGDKTLETNEFSWMTAGAVPFSTGAPTISRVDNVDMAGADFMRAVFRLKVGETGVAVNQPKTTVYVVRITSESPSEEVLRERFLQTGANFEVAHLAQTEGSSIASDWIKELEGQLGVQWRGGDSSAADGE